eukprot:6734416-Karenia_brevis.AAC.1
MDVRSKTGSIAQTRWHIETDCGRGHLAPVGWQGCNISCARRSATALGASTAGSGLKTRMRENNTCDQAVAWTEQAAPQQGLDYVGLGQCLQYCGPCCCDGWHQKVLPRNRPWIDVCYGGDSMLLLGDDELVSSRG